MSEYFQGWFISDERWEAYRKRRKGLIIEYLGETTYPFHYPYDMHQNPTAMEEYGPYGLVVAFGVYEVRIPDYDGEIPDLPGARLEIGPGGQKYLLLYVAVPRIREGRCSPTDYKSYVYQNNESYRDIADPGAMAIAQSTLPMRDVANQIVEDSLRNVRKTLKCANDWIYDNPDSYYMNSDFIRFACTNHLAVIVKNVLQKNYEYLYDLFPGDILPALEHETICGESLIPKPAPALHGKKEVPVRQPIDLTPFITVDLPLVDELPNRQALIDELLGRPSFSDGNTLTVDLGLKEESLTVQSRHLQPFASDSFISVDEYLKSIQLPEVPAFDTDPFGLSEFPTGSGARNQKTNKKDESFFLIPEF